MLIFKNQLRLSNVQLVIASLLVAFLGALAVGLHGTLAAAETSLRQSLDLVLFVDGSMPDATAQQLSVSLKERDREVTTVTYLSRDAALREAQNDPALAKSLMILRENPLPGSFTIGLTDKAWLERSTPAEKLQGPEIQEVRWDAQAQQLYRSVHAWRLWTLHLTIGLAVLLSLWALLGMFRFLAAAMPVSELLWHLALGLSGGGLAAGLWAVSLRAFSGANPPAAPNAFSWLPLIAGAIVGLAFIPTERVHEITE
jgi:hypothetical protein